MQDGYDDLPVVYGACWIVRHSGRHRAAPVHAQFGVPHFISYVVRSVAMSRNRMKVRANHLRQIVGKHGDYPAA